MQLGRSSHGSWLLDWGYLHGRGVNFESTAHQFGPWLGRPSGAFTHGTCLFFLLFAFSDCGFSKREITKCSVCLGEISELELGERPLSTLRLCDYYGLTIAFFFQPFFCTCLRGNIRPLGLGLVLTLRYLSVSPR